MISIYSWSSKYFCWLIYQIESICHIQMRSWYILSYQQQQQHYRQNEQNVTLYHKQVYLDFHQQAKLIFRLPAYSIKFSFL